MPPSVIGLGRPPLPLHSKNDPMPCDSDPSQPGSSALEIERVYLLDRLPEFPPDVLVYRLEQGYLPDPSNADEDNPLEGRLRRTVKADGSVIYTHTIKRGTGLIRQETERTISQAEFDQLWPRTAGRRLTKTRYFVTVDEQLWAVDEFDDLNVVMAEAELPTPETNVTLPDWLAAVLVREVTEEPAYRSYSLAVRAGKLR